MLISLVLTSDTSVDSKCILSVLLDSQKPREVFLQSEEPSTQLLCESLLVAPHAAELLKDAWELKASSLITWQQNDRKVVSNATFPFFNLAKTL